jgi:hypothetical protein
MSQEPNAPNAVEQVLSRALRDNLARIQRNSDELHQAIADVVAACSSAKPTNALPPMLRAQTAAASLGAVLEVLSKFVAVTLQPGSRSPYEAEIARLAGSVATAEPARAHAPGVAAAKPVGPMPVVAQHHSQAVVHPVADVAEPVAPGVEHLKEHGVEHRIEHGAEPPMFAEAVEVESAPVAAGENEEAAGFNVSRLSVEEQELHRRANRVAKVSMQDIKMLRPEQVKLGREHKDICNRLRDDIEKAHREYDRRFKPIMDHPVDYFYRWMVEILADGDAHALGEYPYATTGARH